MRTCPILIVVFIAFLSCKKDQNLSKKTLEEIEPTAPVACFNTSNCFIKPGDTVHFSNCSSDFESVKWEFEEGEFSDQPSPDHVFSEKGIYRVSQVATNGQKSSRKDTTVYCGMSAATTFTFFYSDRIFPTTWPNTLYLTLIVNLYKLPDSLSPIKSFDFGYSGMYSERNFVLNLPLDNPAEKFMLRSAVQVEGHTTGPDPNVDYGIREFQGSAYSDHFGILVNSPGSKAVKLKRLVFNYKRAPVVFQ
jgi:PKD repeat protein